MIMESRGVEVLKVAVAHIADIEYENTKHSFYNLGRFS